MQYLILGANGYIGSYLYRHMKIENQIVIGTGHNRNIDKNLMNYDIMKDSIFDITKLLNGEEKTAIVCIAQTNIDRCKQEYTLSRQINVEFTKKIIEKLVQENFYVIYFSTDNVFDGVKGNYTEQDKTGAVNEYGKMKEEMEQYLTETYPEVCIFRLPKVLSIEKEKQNLFTDFEDKLVSGKIKCIKNTRMSIISKEDIYQACLIAAKQKIQGIYNLSNGEIYSRKELAEKFCEFLGEDSQKIIEIELEEFGFKDNRPLNISLDNTKFRNKTGYEFIPFHKLIKDYLKCTYSR